MGHENRQITRKRANDVVGTAKLENKIKEMFTSPEEAIIIMRPSSLGGGRILRRTLSVCPSVRPSRYRCHGNIFSSTASVTDVLFGTHCVTSRHLANYNDTHVLFGTRRGPHIVRPSRPHKFLFSSASVCVARWPSG